MTPLYLFIAAIACFVAFYYTMQRVEERESNWDLLNYYIVTPIKSTVLWVGGFLYAPIDVVFGDPDGFEPDGCDPFSIGKFAGRVVGTVGLFLATAGLGAGALITLVQSLICK